MHYSSVVKKSPSPSDDNVADSETSSNSGAETPTCSSASSSPKRARSMSSDHEDDNGYEHSQRHKKRARKINKAVRPAEVIAVVPDTTRETETIAYSIEVEPNVPGVASSNGHKRRHSLTCVRELLAPATHGTKRARSVPPQSLPHSQSPGSSKHCTVNKLACYPIEACNIGTTIPSAPGE